MKNNEKINIIVQSFIVKIITDGWIEMEKEQFIHLCQHVDFEKIPERVIADNNEMHDMIPWEKVDRMKIVRLVARNIKIAELVDLSKYNYAVREVKNALKIHPALLDKIDIDLETIGHEDAFTLLTIGTEEISEKIDVWKYDFTSKEMYEIIEYNNFSQDVTRKFNLSILKYYHICEIIKNTGDAFIDVLDLQKLTARKWIEIFQLVPKLLKYCDMDVFKNSDIYNSIELIELFPNKDFDFLIKERNYKEQVSALGWEKLLINKPNEYIEICSLYKLNETNWKNILKHQPQLEEYKV